MRVDEALRWLSFAHDDLRVARMAFQEEIYTQVCFHAQQCVEKVLKALWVLYGKVPPRTHNLKRLWLQMPTNRQVLSLSLEDIDFLNGFYVPTRYPDTLPGTLPEGYPGKEVARKALDLADIVFREGEEHIRASAI